MTDSVLQQRLNEARSALHDLRTGKARVSISSGGRSVTYHAVDAAALNAYVHELEQLVAASAPRRHAIGIRF